MPIIAGNWKMNLTIAEAIELVEFWNFGNSQLDW